MNNSIPVNSNKVIVPAEKIPRYLWVVLFSAFLGWMFDAMDINLVALVLTPSVAELVGQSSPEVVGKIGGAIIGIKLFAWGLGGILFGLLTDKIGRARIMLFTIIIYSVFTGLSALSTSWVQLAIFQALAGLGIGGEWAAGAALVAETWPAKQRARALQIMQMAFAFGFFAAAVVNLIVGPISWRWVFVAGALPALITIFIRKFVKEPERWVETRKLVKENVENGKKELNPSFSRIFKPDLRRATIVGSIIALAMMVGSWGGITWIPAWIGSLTVDKTNLSQNISYAMMLMNLGAILGYLTLIWLTEAVGRKWSYFIFVVGAFIVSMYLFLNIETLEGILWVMPLYGYFAIGGFGTFAAYLPELFPTFIRATGQGFCWNVARLLTSIGPFAGGMLIASFGSFPAAAAVISLVFIFGMVAIWFGPETRGKALEDI